MIVQCGNCGGTGENWNSIDGFWYGVCSTCDGEGSIEVDPHGIKSFVYAWDGTMTTTYYDGRVKTERGDPIPNPFDLLFPQVATDE